MTRIDILLNAYRSHPQFRAMCQTAAQQARKGATPDEILEEIARIYGPPTPLLHLRVQSQPLTVIGEHLIDPNAVAQIRTALRLPHAKRGALLPDAHQGYALPIGGVVAYDRIVAPYQVGVDIGCRMHLSVFFSVSPDDARRMQAHLLDIISRVTVFGVGSPDTPVSDHPILSDPRWCATPLLRSLRDVATLQLGTSGAGNHFAECVVGTWGTTPFVGFLTHSGSRGVGAHIARHYAALAERETARITRRGSIPRDYAWLHLDSEAGQEYLMAMRLAGDFARANHEVIHRRFAEEIGVKPDTTIQNFHNFAWEYPDGTVLHRKGATPAEQGVLGIIPGSMTTASYVVEGLGNPATLASASHGAGRRVGRSVAKRTISRDQAEAVVRDAGVLVRGLSVDECPLVYKDIDDVIDVQVRAGIIRVVAKMQPIAVVMAGTDGDV